MEEKYVKIAEEFLNIDKMFLRNVEKLVKFQKQCTEKINNSSALSKKDREEITETMIRNHVRFSEVSKGIIEKLKSLDKSYDTFDDIKRCMIEDIVRHEIMINNVDFVITRLNELQFDMIYGENPNVDDFLKTINERRN